LGALLFLVTSTSFSASLQLEPQSLQVERGSTLVIDLLMNAPDEIVTGTNASTGGIGGSVIMSFTPGVTLTAFDLVAPAAPAAPPIGSPPGTEAFETAPYVGLIGRYTFSVAQNAPNSILFTVADSDDFFGSFVNIFGTNQSFMPLPGSATVQVIPVPAAAWLMLSALGMLGLRVRRSRP
jgi:hypothetical protein